jgi:hypothetical protein
VEPEPIPDKYRSVFGSRSLGGALAIFAVLCVFGFGLHFVAKAVRDASGFTVGEAHQVSPTTSFTPVDGWVNDPDATVAGFAVVAHKNGWEMRVTGGLQLQPDQTLEAFAELLRNGDSESATLVSDLSTVRTTSGLHGVTWETHGTTGASVTYMVANGAELAMLRADGGDSTLGSVSDDLRQMAESITITGGSNG